MQETHDKRSQLFTLLVLEHVKRQKERADAEAESQRKEEQQQAKVKRLKEDLDRRAQLHEILKKDLEAALLEKFKEDKQLDEAKNTLSLRAQNDQKLKQLCKENDAKTKKAESEVAEFKTQSAEWLQRLILLNNDMDRKFYSDHPSNRASSPMLDINHLCFS